MDPQCIISRVYLRKSQELGRRKGSNHRCDHQCVVFSIIFTHERGPMARRLPPLNGLKAFEAAARSESFTRAAEELNVTQGAVSHQVKALEDTLGLKLFHRERQRLILSEAGRDYLTVIRDALDQIAVGTERLLQRQGSGVLTVSTSPDFAAKWLVNRLSRFAEKYADVDLRISATTHYVDFARDDVDIAIRHGDGNWPGLDVQRLYSERLFPVCSTKLVAGRNRITTAADLLKFPLLRLEDAKNWTRLLKAAGVKATVGPGPVLNRASMLIDAAIDGQRIACPQATSALPKIKTFREWLLAEVADDMRRLKTPAPGAKAS